MYDSPSLVSKWDRGISRWKKPSERRLTCKHKKKPIRYDEGNRRTFLTRLKWYSFPRTIAVDSCKPNVWMNWHQSIMFSAEHWAMCAWARLSIVWISSMFWKEINQNFRSYSKKNKITFNLSQRLRNFCRHFWWTKSEHKTIDEQTRRFYHVKVYLHLTEDVQAYFHRSLVEIHRMKEEFHKYYCEDYMLVVVGKDWFDRW